MSGYMRKTIVLVFLLLCAVAVLTACSSNANPSGTAGKEECTAVSPPEDSRTTTQETEEEEMDERRVIARYQAMQQAMIDKDIDTLDEIILDGTTFTHMSGKTQTKDEYFADIRDGRLDYQSYTMKDAKIVIDVDDATLTCRVVLTANAYGAQGSWPFNFTAHLVWIDGEWYMTN